jgi:hypothetical protein
MQTALQVLENVATAANSSSASELKTNSENAATAIYDVIRTKSPYNLQQAVAGMTKLENIAKHTTASGKK